RYAGAADARARAHRFAAVLPERAGFAADLGGARHGRHHETDWARRAARAVDEGASTYRRSAGWSRDYKWRRRPRRSRLADRRDRTGGGALMEAVNLLPAYARPGHRWASAGKDIAPRRVLTAGGAAACVAVLGLGAGY